MSTFYQVFPMVLSLGAVATPWIASAEGMPESITPRLAELLEGAEDGDRFRVIMCMNTQAVLDACTEAAGDERYGCAVAGLKSYAINSQDAGYQVCGQEVIGLVSELAQEGASEIQQYWINNCVSSEVDRATILGCGGRLDVGVIDTIEQPNQDVPMQSTTFEPQENVVQIGATAAWDGEIYGQGATVGVVASGVDRDHPLLASGQLRRTDGTPIWLDLVSASTEPFDDHGMGTHIAGVAVGNDGAHGVAPMAQWSACKAIAANGATDTTKLLRCMEYLADPDCGGNGAPDPTCVSDPALKADVVVAGFWNSKPTLCDTAWLETVRNLRKADILPVFPVGHDNSGLGLFDANDPNNVPSPANYPESFSVGAASAEIWNHMDEKSYRGVAGCAFEDEFLEGRGAPRVFAPGFDIESAAPGGGWAKMDQNPEIAAAAHVAGAAALMYGERPELGSRPDLPVEIIDEALQRTAVGYTPGATVPPYQAGFLRVDLALHHKDARFVSLTTALDQPGVDELVTTSIEEVAIQLRNNGVEPWQPEVHDLVLIPVGNQAWLPDSEDPRIRLEDGAVKVKLPGVVAPGRDVVFEFNVIVPDRPNRSPGYAFRWQMVDDSVGTFGEPTPLLHIPVRGINRAQPVSVSVYPRNPFPSQNVAAIVRFRNVGTTPWTEGAGYQLLPSHPVGLWGSIGRVDLELPEGKTEVPPCGPTFDPVDDPCVHTWVVTGLQAPALHDDNYPFRWIMLNTETNPFGMSPEAAEPQDVNGTDDWELDWAVPAYSARMDPGQEGFILLSARNSGTNVWPPGTCFKLRDDAQRSTWNASNPCTAAAVEPGDSAEFTLSFTAPHRPGERLEIVGGMHKPGGGAFGTERFRNTVGIYWNFRASDHANAGTQAVGGWFYHYYKASTSRWKLMDWVVPEGQSGYWKKDAGGIWPFHMSPRNSGAIARAWQSPLSGTQKITVVLDEDSFKDLEDPCSNGKGGNDVRVKIKHMQQGSNPTLYNVRLYKGTSSSHAFTMDLAESERLFFILKPRRGNNTCDQTVLDPLIRVWPPDQLGRVGNPRPLEVEDDIFDIEPPEDD